MLVEFFYHLKRSKLKVTPTEFLMLLEALDARVTNFTVDEFYLLARTCLVKDETQYDRFDKAFGEYINGVEAKVDDALGEELPEEWLRKMAELQLSDEEKAEIEAMGGFEKLMETLKERLEEQEKRHQGGNKWIGTAGRSPFGAYGFNPEGVRIGQKESRHRKAVKVWDKRDFKNLDDRIELGTRNIKVALRKLRKFAREGAETELDIDDTIRSTARNGGYLDLKIVPERHNAVKVLIFFDVGGSMDDHVKVCEELFSAVHTEFKHLEYFYFHNFIYETVWKDNSRRFDQKTDLFEVMNKYGRDYKLIFVGDATMSPYEIAYPGGSVEHWNKEAGSAWMERVTDTWDNVVWLNPQPEDWWGHTPSIQLTKELVDNRMYPLTVQGLDRAMTALRNSHGKAPA
ncbi:MAG: hypothetical protein ACI9HX_000447 [Pseudoalteromonas tetraodonis]|jgi:uncharacterized protein with von Willebrand factor type A (vWA) domain